MIVGRWKESQVTLDNLKYTEELFPGLPSRDLPSKRGRGFRCDRMCERLASTAKRGGLASEKSVRATLDRKAQAPRYLTAALSASTPESRSRSGRYRPGAQTWPIPRTK